MFRIAIAFVAAAIGGTAYAQTLEKHIAKCAATKGDLARLECYDAMARMNNLSGPQPAASTPSGVGKWSVSDTTNPIDDSRTVVAHLVSSTGRGRFGEPINLVIRCQSNRTDMYIDWKSYLGLDSTSVIFRIGSTPAKTQRWGLSTDNQATFHPGAIQAIKEMLEHGSVVAQVTPYNESPVTAQFEIEGIANAIKPVRETCSW